MQKFIIILLSLSLALTLGCDDEAQEAEAEEVEEETEEAAEEEEPAEEEAMVDEEEVEAEVATAEDGKISITATASSFEPSAIEAPAGEELEITFTREAEAGCMTEVVFPGLELEKELPLGEAVTVAVTPEKGEAIGFECGMGMGKSTITGT